MTNEPSHHDLAVEFPEHKERIHELKVSDPHFKKLFMKYQELDKSVARAEARIDLISSQAEEELRLERVKIKDELFQLIKSS